ncbi:hypothetical protein L3Y34_015009 [Caenorhabditis briggsae]|uniref:Uncharacterized protein n=1 Tax=Caenorhabditis briggsae TaxID=6238 RepID=A0AAE9DST5_CAEBR|nr:hypothetical protein L3Y34_015009 [Caenorhabditis briggsae]
MVNIGITIGVTSDVTADDSEDEYIRSVELRVQEELSKIEKVLIGQEDTSDTTRPSSQLSGTSRRTSRLELSRSYPVTSGKSTIPHPKQAAPSNRRIDPYLHEESQNVSRPASEARSSVIVDAPNESSSAAMPGTSDPICPISSIISSMVTVGVPITHLKDTLRGEPTSSTTQKNVITAPPLDRIFTNPFSETRIQPNSHQRPLVGINQSNNSSDRKNSTTSQFTRSSTASDRIPVTHRAVSRSTPRADAPPLVETRTASPARQTGNVSNGQNQPCQLDPSRVTNNHGSYSSNYRRRPLIPLFEPAVNTTQHAEQSTWVDESAGNLNALPTTSYQLSPNDAVIATYTDPSDGTIQSTRPDARGYPDMFTDLRRQLAEEDRKKEPHRNSVNREWGEPLNTVHMEFGAISRPSTSMSRRPPVLPPCSKGKKSESEKKLPNVSPSAGLSTHQQQSQNLFHDNGYPSAPAKNVSQISPTPCHPKVAVFHNEIDLISLTSETAGNKTEEELQQYVNAFYDNNPRHKFKESYPFMAEGMVQKDYQTGELKVFSSRLGKTMIPDKRTDTSHDYVYFLVVKPGDFRGFVFDTHPRCLISAKFPSVESIVVRGYAILAHSINPGDDSSKKENRWICWNDSLGMMQILSGSARIPLKKQVVWDKQLDIISIHAIFENGRFIVKTVVALTNSGEKKQHFPNEVFLVTDPEYVKMMDDDLVFFSKKLRASIYIKQSLVGNVEVPPGCSYQLVVAPTFTKSTNLQYRALLLIHKPNDFWEERKWIKEILVERMHAHNL